MRRAPLGAPISESAPHREPAGAKQDDDALAFHGTRPIEDIGAPPRIRAQLRKLEDELDACHSTGVLRQPVIARLVADALHHFDGGRSTLGDCVVMPNHLHLLVGGMARHSMLRQVASPSSFQIPPGIPALVIPLQQSRTEDCADCLRAIGKRRWRSDPGGATS